jgi:predicted nuclease of predicted toxin-antitoxin system
MTFKVDENLPAEIAADLRAQGYEADTVVREGLRGARDPIVLERVRNEGRAFLTMDKGIANVRANPPDRYPGVVLFRPRSSGRGMALAFCPPQSACGATD